MRLHFFHKDISLWMFFIHFLFLICSKQNETFKMSSENFSMEKSFSDIKLEDKLIKIEKV